MRTWGRERMISSTSRVAITPVGARLAMSPASRPALASL
ncbi:Uncharacterised protein [Mycobacteroides abscessus subsp. abscessus]|nr:Uncharacterised protein [Mycobacteroides abscessus subsp. abscessus]